ncbi:MAG: AzlC family ABC transporter permease [Chloroflexota bacterium]|nr:AzlC family ABC transporter permease [Chloroflexota bacterium]
MTSSNKSRELFSGIRDMAPLVLGAIPFGIIFGVLALTAGLPYWATQAMSVFVFAGSSQFIAAGMLIAGVAYPLIVLTTFVVNLRHALYGASVAEYLRGLPKTWRAVLAFGMTDESFAVTITHYRDFTRGDAAFKHWYFLGANLAMFVPWQISTAVGYFVGNVLGDSLALGLDFALPVVFIAILIPQLRGRADLYSAIAAGVVAVAALGLPSKLGLLLAIAVGILAGIGSEEWQSHS